MNIKNSIIILAVLLLSIQGCDLAGVLTGKEPVDLSALGIRTFKEFDWKLFNNSVTEDRNARFFVHNDKLYTLSKSGSLAAFYHTTNGYDWEKTVIGSEGETALNKINKNFFFIGFISFQNKLWTYKSTYNNIDMYSEDLKNWTAVESNRTWNFTSDYYILNDQLFVLDSTAIHVTSNGTHWTRHPLTPSNSYRLSLSGPYNGKHWLVSQKDETSGLEIFSTTNGINWTPESSTSIIVSKDFSLTNYDNKLYIVADDLSFSYSSADGISWNASDELTIPAESAYQYSFDYKKFLFNGAVWGYADNSLMVYPYTAVPEDAEITVTG